MSNTSPIDLSPFFDGIEEIPYKNKGGCLYFCYIFWKWLLKNGHPTESFQINQFARPESSWELELVDSNMAFIKGKNDKTETCAAPHFTWTYQGVEYDADGQFFPEDDGLEDHESHVLKGLNGSYVPLVVEFCEAALEYGEWNWTFERYNATKIVEENLGIETPEHIRHY